MEGRENKEVKNGVISVKMSDIVEGDTVMGEANTSFSCETRQCSF